MTDNSFTITNARVFDGQALSEPKSVFVENGLIAERASSDIVVDAAGRTLLPGFVDAHVHLDAASNLLEFARFGVTTALDMATGSSEFVASLRGIAGVADIRSAGSPASGVGGVMTASKAFDPSTAVTGPDDADRFVADRVVAGSDYIKIIIEDPSTLSAETIAAIVVAAHKAGLLTVAHASSTTAMTLAADAWVDILTHSPLDAYLSDKLVDQMVAKGISIIPTLAMMSGISTKTGRPGYHFAAEAVLALHKAGVPVIAGTDANNNPAVPFSPVLGQSFHDELELMVAAGLTPLEVLRSATIAATAPFGLRDRGSITVGKRADLVLIDGDPLADITATRNIREVWVAGVRVQR